MRRYGSYSNSVGCIVITTCLIASVEVSIQKGILFDETNIIIAIGNSSWVIYCEPITVACCNIIIDILVVIIYLKAYRSR